MAGRRDTVYSMVMDCILEARSLGVMSGRSNVFFKCHGYIPIPLAVSPEATADSDLIRPAPI